MVRCPRQLPFVCASLLQVVDGLLSSATAFCLCLSPSGNPWPSVLVFVSEASILNYTPQRFSFFETESTCGDRLGRQSVCSLISFDSSMTRTCLRSLHIESLQREVTHRHVLCHVYKVQTQKQHSRQPQL